MANMASACALMMTNDSKSSFGPLKSWKRTKAAASTCIIVSIVCICVCVLVTCGVLLLREYSLASGYEETICTIKDVVYTGRELPCLYCPEYKKGKDKERMHQCIQLLFPCVQITASYTVGSTNHEAVLHTDSLHSAGMYNECSYSVCLKSRVEIDRAVDVFADIWRRQLGQSRVCYYNRAQQNDVIEKKLYTLSDVINSMLWPSVVIIICCGVFLYLESQRRKLTFCGVRKSAEDESSSPDSVRMNTTEPEHPEHQATTSSGGQEIHDTRVLLRSETIGGDEGLVGRLGKTRGVKSRDDFVVCKVLKTGGHLTGDKKAWTSYSSLEKLIVAKDRPRTTSLKVEDSEATASGQSGSEACTTELMCNSSYRLKEAGGERHNSINL